jgi:hypothetical protein
MARRNRRDAAMAAVIAAPLAASASGRTRLR